MPTSLPALMLCLAPFLLGSAGCLLMVVAGRRYVGGRARSARGLGRRAGWLLLAGDGALSLAALARALGGPAAPSWTVLAGAALLAAAAAAGLLGGLSGKPRPADGLATALHLGGAGFLLAAL